MGINKDHSSKSNSGEIIREEFEHGVVREWLNNRQIVAYTIPSARRQTVDVWFRIALEVAQGLSENQLDLSIHDFLSVTGLTPYMQIRSQELAKATSRTQGYVAIVLPDSVMGHVARIFVDFRIKQTLQRKTKVFNDRAQASAWLTEYLPV